MKGTISSEIQRERNSLTDITRGTRSAESTACAEHSAWTARKIIILASLFLVYFVVFAAYSVFTPFFPSEVSFSSVQGRRRGDSHVKGVGCLSANLK